MLHVTKYRYTKNHSQIDDAIVDNVTSAINAVMRGLKLGPGDGVMITSLTYKVCKEAAAVVCRETGAELYVMEIKLPISRESIIKIYQRYDHR